MGREIRRVPENWEHPKDENGNHIPLFDHSYKEAVKNWDEENEMWPKGFRKDFVSDEYVLKDVEYDYPYIEWAGERPVKEDHMPEWDESEKTHIQMYETCTEGTPISPVMDTPEKLARWLADNNASAFGSMTASYDEWLRTCRSGFAPSAILDSRGFRPGVGVI